MARRPRCQHNDCVADTDRDALALCFAALHHDSEGKAAIMTAARCHTCLALNLADWVLVAAAQGGHPRDHILQIEEFLGAYRRAIEQVYDK